MREPSRSGGAPNQTTARSDHSGRLPRMSGARLGVLRVRRVPGASDGRGAGSGASVWRASALFERALGCLTKSECWDQAHTSSAARTTALHTRACARAHTHTTTYMQYTCAQSVGADSRRMRCDAMRCAAMRCDAMRCNAACVLCTFDIAYSAVHGTALHQARTARSMPHECTAANSAYLNAPAPQQEDQLLGVPQLHTAQSDGRVEPKAKCALTLRR